jgi:membrane protein
VTGAIFLLWASLGLIKNIDFAFQRIWKIKTRKSIFRRMHLYWLLLVAIPVVLALVTGLKSVSVINEFSHHVEHEFLFSLWLAIFIWALYKIIPDTKVSLITSGFTAVLASFAITLVQKSFLWFSIKVFTNNRIYGSLASFPIFLIWLLVVWWVVLGGAALCAFLQKKMFKTALIA